MSLPFERLLRRNLRSSAPYRPGTSVAEVVRRFGISDPVKLSQNENPLGTSARALDALHAIASLSDYDEDDHLALRVRLAAPYGLDAASVTLGHGSNELLASLFATFVEPADEIVMARPTFSLFRRDADIAGATTVAIPLRDGVHDLDAMLAAVTPRTKLVIVCDPNNPTGTRVERDALVAFARALRPDVLLVLDQAYREYMDEGGTEGVDILRLRPATVVLRTASKIYGLAAVRFGYGYAPPEIVSYLDRTRLPFNVGRPAAAAVLAALDDDAFVARSRANNAEGMAFLEAAFARLELDAYPSVANFLAVRVPVEADVAYAALLERGVIVRSGAGLGMPDRLRVSIGTPADNARFVAELETLVGMWRRETANVAR